MKSLILVIALVGLVIGGLSGCASVSYQSADGTSITYSRLFTTADSIDVKVGNASAKVNGQKIDAASLSTLLNLIQSGQVK